MALKESKKFNQSTITSRTIILPFSFAYNSINFDPAEQGQPAASRKRLDIKSKLSIRLSSQELIAGSAAMDAIKASLSHYKALKPFKKFSTHTEYEKRMSLQAIIELRQIFAEYWIAHDQIQLVNYSDSLFIS